MPGDSARLLRLFRDHRKMTRAITRIAPLTRPTTIPAMERLLRAWVLCGEAPLLAKLVSVADAEDEEDDIVDVEDVKVLDVELDVDDMVDEVVLLLVEEVVCDDRLVVELGLVVQLLDMNGIDMEVGLEVGMTGAVVGRLNVVGIVFEIVGTCVPGTDAGGVHWKPLGTSVGTSVPVYVTYIGTTTPVGATVGTEGKSTVVKTFGPALDTPGVN
jgi:hypothetical protein